MEMGTGMDLGTFFVLVGGQLVAYLPTLIGLIVALILLVTRKGLHSTVRALGLWGFGLLLAAGLTSVLGTALIQVSMSTMALTPDHTMLAFGALGLVTGLMQATGLVLLALAIVRRAG